MTGLRSNPIDENTVYVTSTLGESIMGWVRGQARTAGRRWMKSIK